MELFCIEHGTMEKAQVLFYTVKITHPDGVKDEKAIQIGFIHEAEWLDWCDFGMGWATCPPPENFPDVSFSEWLDYPEVHCTEPGVEEMEIINMNAEILQAELDAE